MHRRKTNAKNLGNPSAVDTCKTFDPDQGSTIGIFSRRRSLLPVAAKDGILHSHPSILGLSPPSESGQAPAVGLRMLCDVLYLAEVIRNLQGRLQPVSPQFLVFPHLLSTRIHLLQFSSPVNDGIFPAFKALWLAELCDL